MMSDKFSEINEYHNYLERREGSLMNASTYHAEAATEPSKKVLWGSKPE